MAPVQRAADLELSLTLGPDEVRALSRSRLDLDDTVVRRALDDATARLPRGTAGRFGELDELFFEILQSPAAADVPETLLRFTRTCDRLLEDLDPRERLSPRGARLSEEADTWRLLHCLHLNELRDSEPPPPPDPGTPSPKGLVSRLFAVDGEVRLMQTVVDWLERCTAIRDAAIPRAGRVGGSLHWENTLHHVQNGESLFDSNAGGGLVTELDPDAPRRQRRNLHALDRRDDDDLCGRIFKEIRCGRFEDAVSLCVDSGQMWRGVVLQGGRLLEYPEPPRTDARFPLRGNPSRDLWKWNCSRFLRDAEENAHFRATLGVLCGDAEAALPLCSDTWEDLLWVHLRVQIEARVDRHLREHHDVASISPSEATARELSERPDGAPELAPCGIFARVAGARDRPETVHQRIQRCLVLDRRDALLELASSLAGSADADLLRFLAHLVVVLRRIGKEPRRDPGDGVLEAYARRLIEGAEARSFPPEPIAHCVSALPPKAQPGLYAELMRLVEGREERLRVAEAGARAGLDVGAAAEETVRRAIRELAEGPVEGDGAPEGRRTVRRVADSLEWLSFDGGRAREAVSASNSIVRILALRGDVDSATAALARLTELYPSAEIARRLGSASSALREHLCLKAYLEAVDGYAAWCRQRAGGRPESPEPPSPGASFADRVHLEAARARVELQRERWNATGAHCADRAKQLLYNVLLFPQGWLVDDAASEEPPGRDPAEAAERDEQLRALRRLCVPEIVLLLLKVLQSGGVEGHVEAIRLAEILASNNRKLYSLFSKHKLREVLHKISESSLCALENDRDPWGFRPVLE